jgi:hypothetical protein
VKTNLRSFVGLVIGLVLAKSALGFVFITDNRSTGALPIKWPPGTVAIQIKLGSNSDGSSNYSAAAQAASQDWNAVIGNLQITSTIAAPSAAAQSNGVNELVFAANYFGTAFDSSTLAITTTFSIGGNTRTQADLVFNTAFTWSVYDGPRNGSPVDLRRVALHELGHLLGLDHPDQATPPQSISAVMNSRISNVDRLTSDDIAGAQELYGPPGAPSNDDFANAISLTLGSNNATSTTGYNTNATKQSGEPSHAGSSGTHSVWWKWTAPAAGSATVDTRGSYFDTALGVYTGSTVNNLTTIGSNDDISTTPHIQASTVTFTATAGQTYYFAVDGWDGDSAGVTLNLSFSPSTTPAPTITSQPASASVTAGGTASFSVTASNATSYQWSFNNSPISGATSATYTISSAQTANAGSYFVTVTNSGGSVVSNSVTLTVNSAPTTPTPPISPSSSGGGGGGGAPSLWFYGAASLLAFSRFLRRRR